MSKDEKQYPLRMPEKLYHDIKAIACLETGLTQTTVTFKDILLKMLVKGVKEHKKNG